MNKKIKIIDILFPQPYGATKVIFLLNMYMVILHIVLYGPGIILRPSGESLIRMGALVPLFFFEGEIWRIVTYGYLHIGFLHLAFNMYAFWQIGPVVEEAIGTARLFILYTLCLVGAGFLDLWVRRGEIAVIGGASGALFGLIGFGISFSHFLGPQFIRLRNFYFQWAIYGFVFGFVVGADNIAHLGGLIVGLALGLIFERERRMKFSLEKAWMSLAIVLLVMTLACLVKLITYDNGLLNQLS